MPKRNRDGQEVEEVLIFSQEGDIKKKASSSESKSTTKRAVSPAKKKADVVVDLMGHKVDGKLEKEPVKFSSVLASLGKKKKTEVADLPTGGMADGIADEKWKAMLADFLAGPKFKTVEEFINTEISQGKEVFPPRHQVFQAFNYTPFDNLKVVLIGQDPYHDNGQAHGLCFSVMPGIKTPPSLVNMYKELEQDIPGFVTPNHGYLADWAKQGVLMLNASLTVEAHKANSHSKCGWMDFTDNVIKTISDKSDPVVFLLWGGFAQKKKKLINATKHKIIECAHPSPLSVMKWRGCKTFSACNAALAVLGKDPINWLLPKETKAD